MDNSLLLILLLFIISKKKDEKVLEIEEKLPVMEKNKIILKNNQILNISRTKDKINIMKKIGPYFPEEYINPINKALSITEQIVVLHTAMEFIGEPKTNYIQASMSIADNRERIGHIMNTIKNEVSKEEIKDMGLILDIIFNMDKYKSLINMLSTFMSDPNSLNEPEKILELVGTFMDGKSEEEKKKIREMMKMLEVLKTMDKK
ncbi:MAG: hypothetical protein GX968_05885 [Tissierellia bacterium]|nr:hypothetical protein [Tissierellia bacterium]